VETRLGYSTPDVDGCLVYNLEVIYIQVSEIMYDHSNYSPAVAADFTANLTGTGDRSVNEITET